MRLSGPQQPGCETIAVWIRRLPRCVKKEYHKTLCKPTALLPAAYQGAGRGKLLILRCYRATGRCRCLYVERRRSAPTPHSSEDGMAKGADKYTLLFRICRRGRDVSAVVRDFGPRNARIIINSFTYGRHSSSPSPRNNNGSGRRQRFGRRERRAAQN